nr:uncharacterized protein LOC127292809 isoform X4 [Lolium perenne]XP_051178265.1 uncharacterized protein LOC127292809 isoform X4 [Lolium perenne]XP_051178267.1 uncharacterized protein LOC127292809 isoform X4 [Lolium perenne]
MTIISPINVPRLPSHPGGLRGANQSGPHVFTGTVKVGSRFLLQPLDVVNFSSLVHPPSKSMTHGAEYMRDPPSRGSDAAHPRRVLWRFSHGSGWTTPCLDWCRKNPSCPILISTPLCPHLHFPPPPLLGRPPPSAWTRPQQRQRTRARARAAGCGDGVSPYGRSRGTGRTWRLYAATAGRGGCTGSGCGRERAPERGRLDAAATAGCSGGGSPDGRTRGAGWTRRWMDTAGVTATAMAHPRLRFARHLRWKWEPTADAGRGRTAARIRAAGNGGGVGVSQGRPGSGAGPAKSWRAADFDNTGTSTASTAGFKTPSYYFSKIFDVLKQ